MSSNVVLTPAAEQILPSFRTLLEQQILRALGVNGRAVVAGVLQGRPLGEEAGAALNQAQPAASTNQLGEKLSEAEPGKGGEKVGFFPQIF